MATSKVLDGVLVPQYDEAGKYIGSVQLESTIPKSIRWMPPVQEADTRRACAHPRGNE